MVSMNRVEEIEPLANRILGRVAAEDILDPISNEILVRRNEEITEEKYQKKEKMLNG